MIPTTTAVVPQVVISNDYLLSTIINFVGPNQYRFVAGIDQRFHTIYLQTFPANQQTKLNASTLEHARICFGEIPVVESKRTACQRKLCFDAAFHGNLSVLQYLRSVNCEWDESTCAEAARTGHLHVLQWCHENGCPWTASTCSSAASSGHLHVLQWCHENGCPWDESLSFCAAI